MSSEKILFIHVTWGFLIANILIAWIPSLTFPLMIFRELWMAMLLLILIRKNRIVPLIVLVLIALIGGVPFFTQSTDSDDLISYFYGMRDILLIILVGEMTSGHIVDTNANFNIKLFVYIVLSLSLVDIFVSNILGLNDYKNAFKLEDYYANKGVTIELRFGILGDRIALPLYSPNLLCNMLAMYFFFDNRITKIGTQQILPLIVSLFTLAKALPLTVFYYFAGRRWIMATVVGFSLFMASFVTLYELSENDPLLAYHLASINGHLSSFTSAFTVDVFSLFPSMLGSHSHAIKNISSNNISEITGLMESLLLARMSELKFWSIILLAYFVYIFISTKKDIARKAFFVFLLISLLTATSNHPVAWVPALLLIYQKPCAQSSRFNLWLWIFPRKKTPI